MRDEVDELTEAWARERSDLDLAPVAVFSRISLDELTFTGRGHTRLKQLQYLISSGQLDEKLFWRNP